MSNDGSIKGDYFSEGKASPADAMLRQAIAQGIVPATCLLGGYKVRARHDLNPDADVCGSCDGPREKCFGRPRERVAGGEKGEMRVMERATTTTPEERREQRRVIVFGLDRLADDAERRKQQVLNGDD
jgi:hypothetical protein